ncbi:hypothetical protein [Salinisphaera hydrothermalis]|uniref:hypothetical protein n=1 Tax=Salinisphaera hydrothermalis TaxID=563188 RepID=UPI00333F02F7
MTQDAATRQRLQFLVRVVRRESEHLALTDRRLYQQPFTSARAIALQDNADEAERVEAFVGRFGRLQDTLGDKLLPAYLSAEGESPGTALDRLDRAEQLGLLSSADEWLAMRKLRNQMVHEYIEDPNILADALNNGHRFVPILLDVAEALTQAIGRRGWLQ